MSDLPTPDRAVQPQHATYRFTTGEPEFPDTTIEWWEANDTPPTAGSHVRVILNTTSGDHELTFAVGYAVMRMERFPDAEIFAIRLPDGSMVPSLRIHRDANTIGMVVPYIQEMIARYEAVLGPAMTDPTTPAKRVTIVRREPWDWPRADYLVVWRQLRSQHQGRALVRALAERCGVSERSITNWHDWYGYPLHEKVETIGNFPDKDAPA